MIFTFETLQVVFGRGNTDIHTKKLCFYSKGDMPNIETTPTNYVSEPPRPSKSYFCQFSTICVLLTGGVNLLWTIFV